MINRWDESPLRSKSGHWSKQLFLLLALALIVQPALGSDISDRYCVLGVTKASQGDLDGALFDFNQAISVDPQCDKAFNCRGIVRQAKGDLYGAMLDFNDAIKINPTNSRYYSNRGNVYVSLQKLPKAVDDFTKSLSLDSNYAEAYNGRARVRQLQGDLQGAVDDCDHALTLDPKHGNTYYNRALSKEQTGNLAGALLDFNWSLSYNTNFALGFAQRGLLKYKLGIDGSNDISQAFTLDPNLHKQFDSQVAAILAKTKEGPPLAKDNGPDLTSDDYFKSGNDKQAKADLNGAISDFDQAIALKPTFYEAYFNRGLAKGAQKDYSGAIADYDASLNLDQDSDAYLNRGVAKQMVGDLKGALDDFNQALTLKPDRPICLAHRGMIKFKLGQDGAQDLDHAFALDPSLHKSFDSEIALFPGVAKILAASTPAPTQAPVVTNAPTPVVTESPSVVATAPLTTPPPTPSPVVASASTPPTPKSSAGADVGDAMKQLQDLKDKHDHGQITDAEYDKKRAEILGNM